MDQKGREAWRLLGPVPPLPPGGLLRPARTGRKWLSPLAGEVVRVDLTPAREEGRRLTRLCGAWFHDNSLHAGPASPGNDTTKLKLPPAASQNGGGASRIQLKAEQEIAMGPPDQVRLAICGSLQNAQVKSTTSPRWWTIFKSEVVSFSVYRLSRSSNTSWFMGAHSQRNWPAKPSMPWPFRRLLQPEYTSNSPYHPHSDHHDSAVESSGCCWWL